MKRLEIASEADRLTVAQVLVKNGYTVCQAKSKPDGKTKYVYYLEYIKSSEARIVEK